MQSKKSSLFAVILLLYSCVPLQKDTPYWYNYNNPVPRYVNGNYVGKFCINMYSYNQNHHHCKSKKCHEMYREDLNRKYNIRLDHHFESDLQKIKEYCKVEK